MGSPLELYHKREKKAKCSGTYLLSPRKGSGRQLMCIWLLQLMKLETMSFLEFKGEGSVILHDVYTEFARYELELEAERRRCVYSSKDALPWSLASTAPGACWPDLMRVKLQSSKCAEFESSRLWWLMPEEGISLRVPGEKLREWANVQVLHLDFAGEHIDVGPLKCLRALPTWSIFGLCPSNATSRK